MKRLPGLFAFLMVAVMLLTACGTSSGNTPAASSAASTAASSAEASSAEAVPENPVDLTVAFAIFGGVPNDLQLVEDEINKITLAKINAKVKLMPVNIGTYFQQMNLMMSGSEKLDLLVSFAGYYTGYVAKNQLLPLDDLLAKNGQGISNVLEADFLKAGAVNGKIYGVATIRDLAKGNGILMRKDMVDKYQIDVSKIQSLNDLEPVLKTIKEKEPNVAPLIPSSVGSSMLDVYTTSDILGDKLGVLMNYGADLKVVDLYETEEYANQLKLLRSWYTAGYIMKDAATNKDDQFSLLKANKAFCYFVPTKPGLEGQDSRTSGVPMVMATLTKPYANTSTVANVMWSIPRNATNPDKAMQMMDLLYADKDIENLLAWGVEGKHYAVGTDGTIDYPAGVDAKTSGYTLNQGWEMGNQLLTYVWKGDPADLWKQMEEFNKGAAKSKAMGFTFDPTPVKTEQAALTNVVNQYKLGLETGSVDPDKVLPQFIAKLKSAGIDKLVAEKQKQLDAWAKANNVQ